MITIHEGDCLTVLRTFPDNFIDSCVTDPPYGLKFLNKKWDHDVPSVEVWQEVLRVLKPGGHLLSFGGTRTYHRMVVAIEDAGFEIRDQFGWLYSNGFPKHKTVLKPAWEPIAMARKPFSGTVAANVEAHGTGALNIEGCRIALEPVDEPLTLKPMNRMAGRQTENKYALARGSGGATLTLKPSGRWPANVVTDGSPEVVEALEASGCAPRFFYAGKAGPADRCGSNHPTVKPVALMRYLCRLVTPVGGLCAGPVRRLWHDWRGSVGRGSERRSGGA